MKRVLWVMAGLAVMAVVILLLLSSDNGQAAETLPTVTVTRSDIVDRALAVGTIEPRVEISVKSQVAGVVRRLFVDAGDYVEAGTPLLEIQPNPTPQELIDAERRIELRQLEVDNLRREFERQQQLFERRLISEQEYERARRAYEEARLQLQAAREQLALLREGRVQTESGRFETVVRAPISGYVLEKMIEVGDPVVPLTSYQEGTVLMTMADMNDLVFRGTVDEIDVGRLQEGMTAQIKIGALPQAQGTGRLSKIWLKAKKEENATVFPVEIEIVEAVIRDPRDPEAPPRPLVLRAGYSANAEIIIEKRENVLLIPERVVTYSGDTARVMVVHPDGTTEERIIQTGLSDALHVEVVSGLEEGMKVQEKPLPQIQ